MSGDKKRWILQTFYDEDYTENLSKCANLQTLQFTKEMYTFFSFFIFFNPSLNTLHGSWRTAGM